MVFLLRWMGVGVAGGFVCSKRISCTTETQIEAGCGAATNVVVGAGKFVSSLEIPRSPR
ncbi:MULTISPECIES: hypothetical protein [unclassified Rhizobium]|uniref:hypothetical protein n=1 Tax=unclassified Rhizobium TaxID=2613769 RepID=UPI001ADB583F|nr:MULTISPECIES: hypothetical protein [unclassified Rhizobium]MBO9133132.1 hypothetical protein [Rhizobium sp. B209b/85]MBO9098085.1 hypothetical protein [Rhizobium sp. L58/93]MBO9184281.1 hypothetical protein [Rhizobium sp. E27B/91]QXZ84480.1 hypothetical protein J5287_02710 [Rhizobium sp. K1/93]QXZ91380.1 hypothetical protein J5280_07290 [Rhizobium sp. K15/93]